MRIGLIGCEFSSPNKGCEALTYSILMILNDFECVKQGTIIYNFSNTNLGKVPDKFPKFHFVNVEQKLKDFSFNFLRKLKKCDIILDATMGDSFSDIYSESYFNVLIRNKRIAELLCKNYILLPQTYGPFKNKKSEKKAIKVLRKAKKIYSRDEMSKQLLEDKFKIKNVELVSDMAFILPYNKQLYTFHSNDKIKLGINVSGLLYRGGFHSENQFDLEINYKDYIEEIINFYSKNEKYEVHIIPHVIDTSENIYDDDSKVCEMLQKKYNNCILAPVFEDPIEAKSYISNMDIFIGSRMHSTIAAFSSEVVTIPLSYSRKFEGLFNSLNYDYVINGRKEDTQSAISKTIEYITNYDTLKNKQKISMKIIEEKKKNFILSLENELEKMKVSRG